MLCNISQNAMRQRGGTRTPPGGYLGQGTPRGYPGQGTPPGGYPGQVPPWGGTQARVPPGGRGVPRSGYPPRGGTRVRYPSGGYPGQGTPGGVPRSGTPPGGTRVGQQKEYSLHGGRYASCVHAGGLSCHEMTFVKNFNIWSQITTFDK